jgi:hypothetical protein
MTELGDSPRLALEPRHALAIGRERFGQNLQRDLAIQLCVACPIHLSHPA